MKFIYFLLFSVLTLEMADAQQVKPAGGGGYNPPHAECITPRQRKDIQKMIDSNIKDLKARGIMNDTIKHNARTTSVLFSWPLQQVVTNYFCYYGISNYVDHNPAYPNQLLDWNCGDRTYDDSTGYNHAGTDIFLWPYSWNMMDEEAIKIVAAAPGTIVGKYDGNYDRDCAMSATASWNAVYIQHADGTQAWYGHMKSGTVTTLPVGTTVAAGDYLGYVGSSGSSTGPHLHFEVHDSSGNIRDPYPGACNTLSNLWDTTHTYYESQVNALMTHFAAPAFAPCPTDDTINECDTFAPGSTIYFATYYHDQLAGQITTYTINKPDGSLFRTWTFSDTVTWYAASYWYWYYTIPATDPLGQWSFTVSFQGSTYTHYFYILFPALVSQPAVERSAMVYPNPATSYIMLGETADELQVFNALGALVLHLTNVTDKINISCLPAGVYYFKSIQSGIPSYNMVVKTQ